MSLRFVFSEILIFEILDFLHIYPRDAMLVRVSASATCLSVRPSVLHTPVLCQNEQSYSVMISSPCSSHTILVFWCQISSRHSKGSPQVEPQTRVGWENSAIF